MKLKIRDLLDARRALGILGTISLPARAAYVVARNARKVSAEVEFLEEARVKLLKECEATTVDGKSVFPSKELEERANTEFKDLIDTEVDVDVRELNVADLGNSQVPPAAFVDLWWMFKEE